jgi:hypothetical protein
MAAAVVATAMMVAAVMAAAVVATAMMAATPLVTSSREWIWRWKAERRYGCPTAALINGTALPPSRKPSR